MKITASYQMTNCITSSKHWYNIVKKSDTLTREQISAKFITDLNSFPAYVERKMYVSSDILITNYKGQLVDEIKTANLINS